MRIENNQIEIEVTPSENQLVFKILKQTPEFTSKLASFGTITDDKTGLSIRSHNHPSFNHKESRFYVRGADASEDNKTVTAKFKSEDDVWNGIRALQRMINAIENSKPAISVEPGGTSAVRMAL